ncbi:MAG: hypothetical protein FWF23_03530 [Alphaproteobacteria bacterium]|nr:hypothetical protein [Alphaproteobacteria bacterium]MCL2505694.1 hypothetical protein [Alphaproteobacteria bacterium]
MSKYDVFSSIHKQFKQAAKDVCNKNSQTKIVEQNDPKNFKSSAQVETCVGQNIV